MQDKQIFSSLSFVAVFGSEIWDPGSGTDKNQDPWSGINIPDPQHWYFLRKIFFHSKTSFLSLISRKYVPENYFSPQIFHFSRPIAILVYVPVLQIIQIYPFFHLNVVSGSWILDPGSGAGSGRAWVLVWRIRIRIWIWILTIQDPSRSGLMKYYFLKSD